MPKYLIQARWVKNGKTMRWKVTTPKCLGGGRRFYEDKKQADKRVAELEKARMSGATRFSSFPPDLQTAVLHAVNELGDGNGLKIVEAVRFYRAHITEETRCLKAAIDEIIIAKTNANLRARYVGSLENSLRRFALGREDVCVHQVSIADCEAWINQSGLAPDTRRSRKIDLGTFFNFCVKRKYLRKEANPLHAVEKISRDEKMPTVLTVAQCEDVLKMATTHRNADLLAVTSLMMFGGLRPYEAYRLTWDDVRGDVIKLDGAKAKKRDIRNVTVNATLKSWLDHARELAKSNLHGGLPAVDGPKQMAKVHKVVNPWPQDGLRHSFVSYHMELHGWEQTVKEAGHSIAMAFDHYRALVTKSASETFWNIRPLKE